MKFSLIGFVEMILTATYEPYQAKNKIFFVSPYAADPKKMALSKKIFHDLERIFFFFITKIHTFSLEDISFLHVLCYFSIQFYCQILN